MDKELNKKAKLILLNDNLNTFDNVIDSLTDVLNWSVFQSEQAAVIVHSRGEFVLKEGETSEMLAFEALLKKCGLSVKVVINL